jgi:hypothetical protein
MSECRYCEFLAIDRPLTTQEQGTLRRSSARATITPSRFAVGYAWRDFKGNAAEWVEKYFDVAHRSRLAEEGAVVRARLRIAREAPLERQGEGHLPVFPLAVLHDLVRALDP